MPPAARLLLVDDDDVTLDALGDFLRAAGFEVLVAGDGREGVATAERERPDLVLLDVEMPGMDGFQALAAMRARAALATVPVLFLSALDRPHVKVRGLDLGADDYVTKPCDLDELLARIRTSLRRAARQQPRSGLDGALGPLSLGDLLQSFQPAGHVAHVSLADVDAELDVGAGRLLGARLGAFTGQEAFRRILLLERGRFSVEFGRDPPAGPPIAALTAALMDATAYVDEVRAQAARAAPGDPGVTPFGSPPEGPEWGDVGRRLPLRVSELVASMPGELKENVATVARAIAAGTLALPPVVAPTPFAAVKPAGAPDRTSPRYGSFVNVSGARRSRSPVEPLPRRGGRRWS